MAAISLLTAQISASYANNPDPDQPEPIGRLALVIGNSAYRNVAPLKNPGNDAKLIAETLRSLGFEVIEKTDLSRKGFQAAVDEVAKKAGKYESVLLYYAGHGFQIDGSNYLVPIDSKLRDRKKFASETIDLNGIIGKLEGENRNTLILLDACRDNPAKKDDTSGTLSDGLAQMETGNGTFIAFATQPGNIARDGAGDNSPFSIALAEHMQTEGISISDMMIRVRNTVEERTAGEQTPWDQSSLRSQFYFNPVVEATDSLTEEDLALLEQLDPALREKFMKRFGLNLNEDGTTEGEEVVATVTPSLRIEADNAETEEVAAATPLETQPANPENEAGARPAPVAEGEARSASEDAPAEPRKPGLMVLAMPDEETAPEPVTVPSEAPVVIAKKEEAPQTLAMATPEEITPAIPTPKPAQGQIEPEAVSTSNSDAGKPVSTDQPVTSSDPASAPSNQPDKNEPAPGKALSGLMAALPLKTLTKDLPTKPESSPSSDKQEPVKTLKVEKTPTPAFKETVSPPAIATVKVPVAPVVAPKPAPQTVTAPAKPAVSAPEVSKPQQAAPAATPSPVVIAKAPVPAETKPAPETIVAINKPANTVLEETKPLPVAPKAAPVEAAPAETLAPVSAKPATSTALASKQPVEPASPVKLSPTKTDEKPSTSVALTPTLPKPVVAPALVAATPPAAPVKAADSKVTAPLPASTPVIAAQPVKPAPVAPTTPQKPQTVPIDVAKAGDTGIPAAEPQKPGSLLTSTASNPPSAPLVPGPAVTTNQQSGKEQLLAMADPAPATKLAPAATEAVVAPAPSTEPSVGKFDIPLPGDETDEDKKQLAIKAQKELTRLGCFRNDTDGDWGPRSARALLRFYAEQKLEPDQLEPTAELVSRLSSVDKVVCKNTETDRPKQATKKAPAKATAKSQSAPAKPKAPVAQKVQPKPKPAYKAPPAVAKAPPPAGPKKKITGGALIGAFR